VGCQQRRRKYKEYAYLEWTTNANLQLHRLTQEELKLGTWSGCTNEVPITKADDILASLDISDLEHPILASSVTAVEEESKTEGDTQVEKAKDSLSASDDAHPTAQSSTIFHTSNEDHMSNDHHESNDVPATTRSYNSVHSLADISPGSIKFEGHTRAQLVAPSHSAQGSSRNGDVISVGI
jgi:hypothetical protein